MSRGVLCEMDLSEHRLFESIDLLRISGQLIDYSLDHQVMANDATSRENDPSKVFHFGSVDSIQIQKMLPELDETYRNGLLDLVQRVTGRRLICAPSDDVHGVYANIQKPEHGRTEAHVDTNPVAAILYVGYPEGLTGGQLLVADSDDMYDDLADFEITKVVNLQPGKLIVAEFVTLTHFTTAVFGDGSRVAVVGNYYNPDFDFKSKQSLIKHLGLNRGTDV